jgi:hypothetical protein
MLDKGLDIGVTLARHQKFKATVTAFLEMLLSNRKVVAHTLWTASIMNKPFADTRTFD